MNDHALEIDGLGRRRRGFALQDVTLRVPRGTVMGMIGRNGAGKSTIMRAVMDLVGVDAGTIRIFGLDHRVHHVWIGTTDIQSYSTLHGRREAVTLDFRPRVTTIGRFP